MTGEKKQTKEESTKTGDSEAKQKNVFEEFGDSVGRFATRTFESIKQTIDKSLIRGIRF